MKLSNEFHEYLQIIYDGFHSRIGSTPSEEQVLRLEGHPGAGVAWSGVSET